MRTLIVVIFLGIQPWLFAQDSSATFLSITYLGGQITHPGLKLGYGQTLREREKVKVKRSGKEKHKSRHWIGSANVAAQVHYKYRTAVLIYPEMIYRTRNDDSGWFKQVGVGIGYQRSFQKDVYRVENEQARKVWLGGNNQGCMMISVSLGRDLSITRERQVLWTLGPTINLLGPGFNGITSYLFFEAGISLKLNRR